MAMASELRFDDKVVIVTGAGGGLGRAHALLFASRGAKVVVNDLGGSMHGGGGSSRPADAVVEEIRKAGGTAVASYDSVEDGDKIVKSALDAFGRLDVVVNNAGILRDKSFHKMSVEDWDLIYRVHVSGSFRVTHAAWPVLREQGYGRIVMTASAAGIYGNFGQANYSMAKLGLYGFAQTLAAEGGPKGVHVNTIAPIAGSRLTETVLPKELIDALKPEYVSPLVAWLCHESCQENGGLFEVGGGFFAKLRWERTRGATVRLGRAIVPETVQKSWKEITSFDGATHPASVNESMAPVMQNVQAGPSKGGNEHIDVDAALGWQYPKGSTSYDERDVALYALGVGAAHNPLDKHDLRHVYELHPDGLCALPTFGVIPAMRYMLELAKEGVRPPGFHFGLERLLHGEQYLEITRPLPPRAKLEHRAHIQSIWDKGKGAVIVTEAKSFDESGELVAVNEFLYFIRGAGGWGGDRGPAGDANTPPERAPDAVVEEKTADNQALLYRLSGDWNPMHADPGFATMAGFERPILHGMCTFGYAARHVIAKMAGGDSRRFKSMRVRLADVVYPGETLVTEMWREAERVVLRCKVKERDKVVLSNAAVALFSEVPKPKPRAQPAAAPQAAPTMPVSADIFTAIGRHIAKSPELAGTVGKTFLFKLRDPESAWLVDLKNDKGGVKRGEGAADCTLSLSDADFMAMVTGQADAQKLYFGGQLKIAGDIMASQKLTFLRKLDQALVLEAMRERAGAAPSPTGSPAAAAAPAAPGEPASPTSADVFLGIEAFVAESPGLVEKVQTVFQFRLVDPASVWTIDLKNGKGNVGAGETASPDTTLTLSDADFMALTSGQADPQQLYFGGKLKIAGNLMAAQKLTFLKKIDPEWARQAVARMRGERAGQAARAVAAPAAPGRTGRAAEIFRALGKRIEERPALAGEVQALVEFVVTAPDAAWAVDLRRAPGAVKEGRATGAATTLTLSDEDLEALATGAETAQALFQRGKLRVDGEMRVAQRLGFMSKLI
jgi:3-hydroxyacyl-CoA dehydrogenase/3a,7a,12a-trihydroxy-5b-cholest-24-enoyl-CoA hydratase